MRIVNDSHPQIYNWSLSPYVLTFLPPYLLTLRCFRSYIELGNEQYNPIYVDQVSLLTLNSHVPHLESWHSSKLQ